MNRERFHCFSILKKYFENQNVATFEELILLELFFIILPGLTMKRMKIFTKWFHAELVQKILNGSREGGQPPAVSSKGLRGHPEAAEVHHHGGGAAAADGGDQPQLEAGDVFLHP